MALFNIGGMRKPYNEGDTTFTEDMLVSKNPFQQFSTWFDEACKADGIIEPNAMCLATATKDGIPSSRIVLLKGYSKEGFAFYTKYISRKGEELLENPKASLCFYWEPLNRSIRIEGDVQKVSDEASTAYFISRPRGSQVAAYVSCRLPKVIACRDRLIEEVKNVEKDFDGKEIPRPKEWGGYLVVPRMIEFWQGQTDRTHDRIVFRRKGENEEIDSNLTKEGEDGWLIERCGFLCRKTVFIASVREPTSLFDSLYGYYNFKEVDQVDKDYDLVLVAEKMEERLILLRHLLCWTYEDVATLKVNARCEKAFNIQSCTCSEETGIQCV